MSVIVTRFPGDKPGPNIVDPILKTREAQEERGRQEINTNGSDRVLESGTIIGTGFKKPGSMLQISNDQGVVKAKLTSFSLQIVSQPFSLTSSIRAERIK